MQTKDGCVNKFDCPVGECGNTDTLISGDHYRAPTLHYGTKWKPDETPSTIASVWGVGAIGLQKCIVWHWFWERGRRECGNFVGLKSLSILKEATGSCVNRESRALGHTEKAAALDVRAWGCIASDV